MSVSPVPSTLPMPGRGTGVVDGTPDVPLDWAKAESALNTGAFCWLTTLRPDGAPHVRPVFATWSESVAFVSSNASARKSLNLDNDGRCTVTTDANGIHLVVEGIGTRVRDLATLHRASDAFENVYGWPTTPTGDQLDASYGAPTSGGPPYSVYQITPTLVYAFPADASFMPTRWQFPATA